MCLSDKCREVKSGIFPEMQYKYLIMTNELLSSWTAPDGPVNLEQEAAEPASKAETTSSC